MNYKGTFARLPGHACIGVDPLDFGIARAIAVRIIGFVFYPVIGWK